MCGYFFHRLIPSEASDAHSLVDDHHNENDHNFYFSIECKAKADVGFIIDGSGSIENAHIGNYKKVLQFVENVVKAFEVSKGKTHIGIISYDHDAKVGINLLGH